MKADEREPTADEAAGMAWWNAIDEMERAKWFQIADSAVVADAWKAFKRIGRPVLKQDPVAWKQGYEAGLSGENRCPYSETVPEAWAWSSGWIEGDADRQKGTRRDA